MNLRSGWLQELVARVLLGSTAICHVITDTRAASVVTVPTNGGAPKAGWPIGMGDSWATAGTPSPTFDFCTRMSSSNLSDARTAISPPPPNVASQVLPSFYRCP